MSTLVIGVDPGPTTGIAVLHPGTDDVFILQGDPTGAAAAVETLLDTSAADRIVLAIEQFVIGRASMRAGRHGQATRDLIGVLEALARSHATVSLALRSASEVKPWATDRRLAAAGLIEPTRGMGHARDACRHALFAAVHSGLMPDPMSRTAGAR
jgi:hypothetical protein